MFRAQRTPEDVLLKKLCTYYNSKNLQPLINTVIVIINSVGLRRLELRSHYFSNNLYIFMYYLYKVVVVFASKRAFVNPKLKK